MKYALFFVLCVVAMAAAAPQLLTWPGVVAGGWPVYGRTVVAGPTVVNGGLAALGGRLVVPGYVGTTYV